MSGLEQFHSHSTSFLVLNLLDNAVKYSVEGSEIEIQTCLDDSEVIVMVKDR